MFASGQHLIVRFDASHGHWAGSLAAARNGQEVHVFNISKAFADSAFEDLENAHLTTIDK